MTSNYPKIIILYDHTRIVIITDPIVISMKTLRINSTCSLEKELTELIRMNPLIVLYLTVN